MAGPRQTYSLDEIKDMLLSQIESVIARYAPPAPGSYRKGHDYFTLNPGRADRSVGSFRIVTGGAKAGKWNDFAMSGRESHGDVLDLIGLACGYSNPADTIREARAFLGLDIEGPEVRRAREEAAKRAAESRKAAEAKEARDRERRAKWARGLFLSAREDIDRTPVAHYLRGRGIDLAQLGRIPHALRYHPECLHIEWEELFDPETGEVLTGPDGRPRLRRIERKLPAMVAAIVNGNGEIRAVHRTWLAIRPDGSWGKAPFKGDKSKLTLGDVRGGSIRLSTGIGPKGGKGAPLSRCPPGTRVYIGEGIETALSVMVLMPEARVLAAVSLSNMAAVQLPPNVAEVVLLSDGDTGPQQVAAFDAAVQAHAAKGRTVRVWRSPVAGEDLNDALQRAMKSKDEGAAA